jgi:predicted nucleic acid-binding protein
VTSVTDHIGRQITYTDDGSGRLWKVTDADTSPLLHLARIGLLDLIPAVVGRVPVIYFDAAYIAKCYLKEPGSAAVASLAATVATVASCEFARLEFAAILHRHLREQRLSGMQMLAIWQQFEADEKGDAWDWLPVTHSLLSSAAEKVRQLPSGVYLRSADALHLACAQEQQFAEIYTNDRHILAAASHFNLRAINILP